MRKVEAPDDWAARAPTSDEADEKDEGELPRYRGDARGRPAQRLRLAARRATSRTRAGGCALQTDEEHRFCMGCHRRIGVTVDQTFVVRAQGAGRRRLAAAGPARPAATVRRSDTPTARLLTYFSAGARRRRDPRQRRAARAVLSRRRARRGARCAAPRSGAIAIWRGC